MRKIFLISVSISAIAMSALSQGVISFAANSAGNDLITYSLTGSAPTVYPLNPGLATYGNATVGFFTAPNNTILKLVGGLPDFSSWTPIATLAPVGSGPVPSAGSAFVSPITVPVTAGNNIEVEIVAWTGNFTTWANAVAAGDTLLGFSGETFNGSQVGSLGWSQPAGSGVPPTSVLTGSSAFLGIVLVPNTSAPEPATIALSGLGASLIFLFRRLRNR